MNGAQATSMYAPTMCADQKALITCVSITHLLGHLSTLLQVSVVAVRCVLTEQKGGDTGDDVQPAGNEEGPAPRLKQRHSEGNTLQRSKRVNSS
jgi:hypothetical protein